MKVVVVHNSYQQPGGEDAAFAGECRLLEQHGHTVVAYRRSNREIDSMSTVQRLIMPKQMIYSDKSRREIQELLRKEQPDLVHVHNTFMMVSPSVYETCQEMGLPVLQTLHNFRLLCPAWTLSRDGHVCEECVDHGLWRSVWHGCYRDSRLMTAGVALMLQVHRGRGTWTDSVDGYVALSEFARRKFIDSGLPAAKLHVKPNFVQDDPGEREAPGHYALFVGRLSPEKGAATLLAGWEKLKHSIPLVIVGDGPLRQSLESEAAARGLSSVKFRGWLTGEETRAEMKRAAFLVIPSLWYEGFPMIVAEAFACGIPVICSRLGTLEEIVEDQYTGLHFSPGNADDLAGKVEWAWANRSHVCAMGRAARQEYENHYTPERNYRQLMQIYEQTMRSRAQSASRVFPIVSTVSGPEKSTAHV
jgi:glycosyltransferase involved in cell wall biosynthesis